MDLVIISRQWNFVRYFLFQEGFTIKDLLINDQIKADQVRLIGSNSEQLGIKTISEAKKIADDEGLDLVLMSPNAVPVVCKLMDYGKFKFDSEKKEKELRKNQKIVELKEIQLSMTIDVHDMETKAKHGNRFLQEGNKVKISLRMKGRQQAYANNGIEIVKKFYDMLSENGNLDKTPEIVGRNIIAIVSPKNSK